MRKLRSVIAIAIIILMVLSLVSGIVISSFSARAAESVSSMKDELDELAQKKERLEKELDVMSEKKEKELEKKANLDEQVSATSSEINILNNMISTLDTQLETAEKELEEAELKVEENLTLSKERIRSAYEQGNASFLEVIINSSSLHELVSKIEIVSRITKKDNEVIETVKQNKEIIEQKRAEIKENKAENEKAAEQLETKKEQLVKKQNASDKIIEQISDNAAQTQQAVDEIERAEQQLQSEIQAAIRAAQSSGESGGTFVDAGDFMWPLDPKYHNITSPFGYRDHPTTGVYKLHTGTDIASSGIRGKPYYAAKGGTVLKAGYNTAYGNYVLINHGDGYSTLYAHSDSLAVSAGQVVNKGDVLGYVGATGYVTGPHLHFEIIKNGEYTDPLDYFSGVMSFTFS